MENIQLLSVLQKKVSRLIQDVDRLRDILPKTITDSLTLTEIKDRVAYILRHLQSIETTLSENPDKTNLNFLLTLKDKIIELEHRKNKTVDMIENGKEDSSSLKKIWEMYQHGKYSRPEVENTPDIEPTQTPPKQEEGGEKNDIAQLKQREKELLEKEKQLEQLASQETSCPDTSKRLVELATIRFNTTIADSFLDVLTEFQQKQQEKYDALRSDIESIYEKNTKSLGSGSSPRKTEQVEQQTGEGSSRPEDTLKILDKRFLRRLVAMAEDIRQTHFDFLSKRVRKSLHYIHRWTNTPSDVTKEEQKRIDAIEEKHKSIAQDAKNFIETGLVLRGHQKSQDFIRDFIDAAEDKDRARALVEDRLEEITSTVEKILSYYRKGVRWSDIIWDSQFIFLYGTKLINIGLFALAVYVSTVIFKKKYKKDVFEKYRGPPRLFLFTGMILGFFLLFNVFFLLLQILFVYVFQRYGLFSFLNSYFVRSYVIDLGLSVFVMMAVFAVLTYFVSRKRYFNYKIDGYKTIHGLGRMLFFISLWILLNPFFYFYWITNKDSLS